MFSIKTTEKETQEVEEMVLCFHIEIKSDKIYI